MNDYPQFIMIDFVFLGNSKSSTKSHYGRTAIKIDSKSYIFTS